MTCFLYNVRNSKILWLWSKLTISVFKKHREPRASISVQYRG